MMKYQDKTKEELINELQKLKQEYNALRDSYEKKLNEPKKAEESYGKDISSLIHNSPDMIVRFNTDLQHIYCNATVERVTGNPAEFYMGKTFLDLKKLEESRKMSEDSREMLEKMHQSLNYCLNTGEEQRFERNVQTPLGNKHFSTRIIPERNEYGIIESLLAVTHDITERKQAEYELQKKNEELETAQKELRASNEIKSKFLSLISHDVRGAVSSLDGFIELLISRFHRYGSNELQNKLKTIRVTTNSLNQTLQNLLTWSKQDLLQLQPQKEQIDLIAIINKILDFLKPRMEYKDLEVNTDYPSDWAFVYADPNMLETALRNIISNAVKFTENEGNIFIGVFETQKGVEIEISDTGMGMDEKTLNKLFTYNYSKDFDNKEEESSGLGLLLSKEFLDKNEATVDVSSKLGEGTKFTISI